MLLKKEEAKTPVPVPDDVRLLTEIRDLLQQQAGDTLPPAPLPPPMG